MRSARETIVRKGWMICVAVAMLAAVSPARAQFGAPLGSPGFLTSPEAASGAFGAGAAHSASQQQQQCTGQATGRDGPRGVCPSQGARRRAVERRGPDACRQWP